MKEDTLTFELICFVQEGKKLKLIFGKGCKVETEKNLLP